MIGGGEKSAIMNVVRRKQAEEKVEVNRSRIKCRQSAYLRSEGDVHSSVLKAQLQCFALRQKAQTKA